MAKLIWSCELLSKLFIFVTRHNDVNRHHDCNRVVNCFQNCLSSWHDTTINSIRCTNWELWIAFKIVYLRDTTQLFFKGISIHHSCELLSKLFIFVTRHNPRISSKMNSVVVNCFQNCLSSWHDTTFSFCLFADKLLWIAFKIVYLRDTTQPTTSRQWITPSCELLSKLFIFVTRHNMMAYCRIIICVVNCFQNCLSSWHDTTKMS